jgi:hypothetical protein
MKSPTDHRLTQQLGWAALACWLVSWFLPVIDGYPGWAAFRAALMGPFHASSPVPGDDAVPQLLSALTNVAFVALLLNWRRGRVSNWTLYLKIVIACLLIDLYWLVQMLRAGEYRALLAGYYLWLLGFALLAAMAAFNVASARRTSKTPTGDMRA